MLGGDRKDANITAMYCTGGIRCEKASAWMLHIRKFRNVYHLEGGIIEYANRVQLRKGPAQQIPGEEFRFLDERMGERISGEVRSRVATNAGALRYTYELREPGVPPPVHSMPTVCHHLCGVLQRGLPGWGGARETFA